jgi:hypothetical protein
MYLTKLNGGQKKKSREIIIATHGWAAYRQVSIFINEDKPTENFGICKKIITIMTFRPPIFTR